MTKNKSLESIIQSSTSPGKSTVKKKLANSVLAKVVVNADSASIHEATVVSSVIYYLKELNKKSQYPIMH